MLYSLTRILRKIRRRKGLGVLVLLAVVVFSIAGNTLTFVYFDGVRQDDVDITLADGFWFSVVSITTIGYGDISSETLGARLGTGFFIILVGLATFTMAVGMAVDWIADFRQKERTGMGRSSFRGHLIIVNFPGESRVRKIIREYREDPHHRGADIVLITDAIQEFPFAIAGVSFVRGGPLEEETYERANIGRANQAIILSPSHEDERSDSLVASIAFVMNNLNPDMSIVAECLDVRHAPLFNVSERVSLVYTMQVANNLLVQEAQDPGVMLLTQAITSNEIEGTLATTTVTSAPEASLPYISVAKKLLDHDVNLVGVVRDGAVKVSFQGLTLTQGDGLVYIGKSRQTWDALQALLYEMLDYRLSHRRSTWMSSNKTFKELGQINDDRIVSRIVGLCRGNVVTLTGKDRRLP